MIRTLAKLFLIGSIVLNSLHSLAAAFSLTAPEASKRSLAAVATHKQYDQKLELLDTPESQQMRLLLKNVFFLPPVLKKEKIILQGSLKTKKSIFFKCVFDIRPKEKWSASEVGHTRQTLRSAVANPDDLLYRQFLALANAETKSIAKLPPDFKVSLRGVFFSHTSADTVIHYEPDIFNRLRMEMYRRDYQMLGYHLSEFLKEVMTHSIHFVFIFRCAAACADLDLFKFIGRKTQGKIEQEPHLPITAKDIFHITTQIPNNSIWPYLYSKQSVFRNYFTLDWFLHSISSTVIPVSFRKNYKRYLQDNFTDFLSYMNNHKEILVCMLLNYSLDGIDLVIDIFSNMKDSEHKEKVINILLWEDKEGNLFYHALRILPPLSLKIMEIIPERHHSSYLFTPSTLNMVLASIHSFLLYPKEISNLLIFFSRHIKYQDIEAIGKWCIARCLNNPNSKKMVSIVLGEANPGPELPPDQKEKFDNLVQMFGGNHLPEEQIRSIISNRGNHILFNGYYPWEYALVLKKQSFGIIHKNVLVTLSENFEISKAAHDNKLRRQYLSLILCYAKDLDEVRQIAQFVSQKNAISIYVCNLLLGDHFFERGLRYFNQITEEERAYVLKNIFENFGSAIEVLNQENANKLEAAFLSTLNSDSKNFPDQDIIELIQNSIYTAKEPRLFKILLRSTHPKLVEIFSSLKKLTATKEQTTVMNFLYQYKPQWLSLIAQQYPTNINFLQSMTNIPFLNLVGISEGYGMYVNFLNKVNPNDSNLDLTTNTNTLAATPAIFLFIDKIQNDFYQKNKTIKHFNAMLITKDIFGQSLWQYFLRLENQQTIADYIANNAAVVYDSKHIAYNPIKWAVDSKDLLLKNAIVTQFINNKMLSIEDKDNFLREWVLLSLNDENIEDAYIATAIEIYKNLHPEHSANVIFFLQDPRIEEIFTWASSESQKSNQTPKERALYNSIFSNKMDWDDSFTYRFLENFNFEKYPKIFSIYLNLFATKTNADNSSSIKLKIKNAELKKLLIKAGEILDLWIKLEVKPDKNPVLLPLLSEAKKFLSDFSLLKEQNLNSFKDNLNMPYLIMQILTYENNKKAYLKNIKEALTYLNSEQEKVVYPCIDANPLLAEKLLSTQKFDVSYFSYRLQTNNLSEDQLLTGFKTLKLEDNLKLADLEFHYSSKSKEELIKVKFLEHLILKKYDRAIEEYLKIKTYDLDYLKSLREKYKQDQNTALSKFINKIEENKELSATFTEEKKQREKEQKKIKITRVEEDLSNAAQNLLNKINTFIQKSYLKDFNKEKDALIQGLKNLAEDLVASLKKLNDISEDASIKEKIKSFGDYISSTILVRNGKKTKQPNLSSNLSELRSNVRSIEDSDKQELIKSVRGGLFSLKSQLLNAEQKELFPNLTDNIADTPSALEVPTQKKLPPQQQGPSKKKKKSPDANPGKRPEEKQFAEEKISPDQADISSIQELTSSDKTKEILEHLTNIKEGLGILRETKIMLLDEKDIVMEDSDWDDIIDIFIQPYLKDTPDLSRLLIDSDLKKQLSANLSKSVYTNLLQWTIQEIQNRIDTLSHLQQQLPSLENVPTPGSAPSEISQSSPYKKKAKQASKQKPPVSITSGKNFNPENLEQTKKIFKRIQGEFYHLKKTKKQLPLAKKILHEIFVMAAKVCTQKGSHSLMMRLETLWDDNKSSAIQNNGISTTEKWAAFKQEIGPKAPFLIPSIDAVIMALNTFNDERARQSFIDTFKTWNDIQTQFSRLAGQLNILRYTIQSSGADSNLASFETRLTDASENFLTQKTKLTSIEETLASGSSDISFPPLWIEDLRRYADRANNILIDTQKTLQIQKTSSGRIRFQKAA